MNAMEGGEVHEQSSGLATDTDDELVNIQTDSDDVTDPLSDVTLLELDPAVHTPVISLENPPSPESEIDAPPVSSTLPPYQRHHSPSRSHSSRRSRSSRLRHPGRWRSRFQLKKKESNFIAAACSMTVLVLMCTAMAEPQWIYIKGGGCRGHTHDTPIHYLGLNQFFYMGQFIHIAEGHNVSYTFYKYGPNPEEGLIDCVTPQALQVIRSMIALCSIGVVFTIMAFLLDLHGPRLCFLKTLQRHAILSMCTTCVCMAISGFCYWTTQLVRALQIKTKPLIGSIVEVEFSIGFYLIAAAGGMAVITTGCNLLRRPAAMQDDDRERLMHNIDSPPDFYGEGMGFPTPPPPYQP